MDGKKIEIGNIEYQIKESDCSHSPVNMGYVSQMHSTILYKSGLSKTQEYATIWHEVVHEVLDSIGESELSSKEDFVEKLSRALIQCADLKVY